MEVVQAPKGTYCRLKMQTKDESCIGSRGRVRTQGTAEAPLSKVPNLPKTNDSFRVVHNACSHAPEHPARDPTVDTVVKKRK